jgi:MFS family permease
MPFGFYIIMAAQFFSSLADNALLVAAIALLVMSDSPAWMTPLLKFFFTVAYVVLAPFVGAFADALPKGHVMFISNLIKVIGCMLMLFGLDPLLAYGVVGLGAAAYSPAKYGILTELLPHERLVVANGWIEGLTVTSIIIGTLLGGALVSDALSSRLLAIDIPHIDTGIDTAPELAMTLIIIFYAVAAAFNLWVPDTGVERRVPDRNPIALVAEFAHCVKLLWTDSLGRISLAVTTLFWGAGATLQFIVLKWAESALGYTLSQGAMLQAVSALGIAMGAVLAGRFIPLNRATSVLPVGMAMGVVVILMNFVSYLPLALVLMVLIGGLAGFFVVPMNALLQHRGHLLMGAGHSIAVQNFNENLSILVMLALYSVLISVHLSIYTIIVIFGLFVAGTMYFVRKWYLRTAAGGNLPELPGDRGH